MIYSYYARSLPVSPWSAENSCPLTAQTAQYYSLHPRQHYPSSWASSSPPRSDQSSSWTPFDYSSDADADTNLPCISLSWSSLFRSPLPDAQGYRYYWWADSETSATISSQPCAWPPSRLSECAIVRLAPSRTFSVSLWRIPVGCAKSCAGVCRRGSCCCGFGRGVFVWAYPRIFAGFWSQWFMCSGWQGPIRFLRCMMGVWCGGESLRASIEIFHNYWSHPGCHEHSLY